MLTYAAEKLEYVDIREAIPMLHEGIAARLLALPPDEKTGLPRRMHTSKLSVEEFGVYMDKVEVFLVTECNVDMRGWEEEMERRETIGREAVAA